MIGPPTRNHKVVKTFAIIPVESAQHWPSAAQFCRNAFITSPWLDKRYYDVKEVKPTDPAANYRVVITVEAIASPEPGEREQHIDNLTTDHPMPSEMAAAIRFLLENMK